MPAFKVIRASDQTKLAQSGFIPDQTADVGCPFIHACELKDVSSIVSRFFSDEPHATLEIDIEDALRQGFTVKYESNRLNGTLYWHFYRPSTNPTQLLSASCVKSICSQDETPSQSQ